MFELFKVILDGGGVLAFAFVVWWELRAVRASLAEISTNLATSLGRQHQLIECSVKACPVHAHLERQELREHGERRAGAVRRHADLPIVADTLDEGDETAEGYDAAWENRAGTGRE